MQPTDPDAFALKNSGLDTFLYADVGAESNGSTLTILSVLARLGMDPWSQAARWATLPTAKAIDELSQSMSQMPLTPAILAESRMIATRLVQLLPGKTSAVAAIKPATPKPAGTVPTWSTGTMIWCGLAIWMAVTALIVPKIATDVIVPLEQHNAASAAAVSARLPTKSDHPRPL